MAETVSSLKVTVTVEGLVIGDDGSQQPVNYKYTRTFSDGTGTNKIGTLFWDKSRALNTTSEDLDFAGSLTDFQGATVAATDLKLIVAENLSTTASEKLKMKNGSSNPVTGIQSGTSPTLEVGPGGLILVINPIDGYTVTGGSADTVAFETTANMNYQLLVAGENA